MNFLPSITTDSVQGGGGLVNFLPSITTDSVQGGGGLVNFLPSITTDSVQGGGVRTNGHTYTRTHKARAVVGYSFIVAI